MNAPVIRCDDRRIFWLSTSRALGVCVLADGGKGCFADSMPCLAGMGFVAGEGMTIVSTIGENLMVNVKRTRVAISREPAGKIMN